jgi:hypothetical protein
VSANNPFNPNLVTTASAFPSWTVDDNGVSQPDVSLNAISTGANSVTLLTAGNGYYSALDGNYSVLIQAFAPGSAESISQTALIPPGTESIRFLAAFGSAPASEVLIDNQIVPFVGIGSGPNYGILAGDVSEWAGQMAQLTFSVAGGAPNYWEIDDISFSQTAITPEPTPFILTGIGGLILAAQKKLRRR